MAMVPLPKSQAMGTTNANDRVRRELYRALDDIRADIDRIEILAAALIAFSRPVPDYEPGFHLMRHLAAHELGPRDGA